MRVQLVKTDIESYVAYINGELIGTLKLRDGYFTVEYKGQTKFRGSPQGYDTFYNEDERKIYLTKGCEIIILEYENKIKESNYEIFQSFSELKAI